MVSKKMKKSNSNKICARLIHVVLTVGVFIDLMACKTVMHEKLITGDIFLPILYFGFTALSIVLFFVVSCMDPGFVKESDPDITSLEVIEDRESDVEISPNKTSYDSILNAKVNGDKQTGEKNVRQQLLNDEAYIDMEAGRLKFNLKKNQRCGLCALERPLRARHCRECQHCVRKFDHHCPWIANCVGEKNHRWFWLFLLAEVGLMSWSIQISVTGFSQGGSNMVRQNAFLIIADVLMGVMMAVAVSLLFIHTYMLLSNNTTWESMSRHRITYLKKLDSEANPFNMGICRNMYTFFCYCKPFDWHKIYDKMTQQNSDYDSSDSGIESPAKRDNLPT